MKKTQKILIPLVLVFFIAPSVSVPVKSARGFSIRDYQRHLNRKFKKQKRLSTRFIIVHTSEAGLESTLRTLSSGKKAGRSRTRGGHAHYAIARNGRTYRILHHRYRANHTGLSMWNGVTDISSHSIGIELVGYHYGRITKQQYYSLSKLIKDLQRIYRIPDKNVLTHSQVAYGNPNEWFRNLHRGRKRCAINFDRRKAGLIDAWPYDPDVKDGRLKADKLIHRVFYVNSKRTSWKKPEKSAATEEEKKVKVVTAKAEIGEISNIISKDNTAWNIAGEDFDSTTTVYILPGNKTVRGDKIKKNVGWNRLPPGTQVLVNQPLDREEKKGPIFLITKEYTAWSFAGKAYDDPTTIYFFRKGKVITGDKIRDWDEIPASTRLIIGYRGPVTIKAQKGKTPWSIAGKSYNKRDTIYLIPGKGSATGDKVENFNTLPRKTAIFFKIN